MSEWRRIQKVGRNEWLVDDPCPEDVPGGGFIGALMMFSLFFYWLQHRLGFTFFSWEAKSIIAVFLAVIAAKFVIEMNPNFPSIRIMFLYIFILFFSFFPYVGHVVWRLDRGGQVMPFGWHAGSGAHPYGGYVYNLNTDQLWVVGQHIPGGKKLYTGKHKKKSGDCEFDEIIKQDGSKWVDYEDGRGLVIVFDPSQPIGFKDCYENIPWERKRMGLR